jgi:hypothetical protein
LGIGKTRFDVINREPWVILEELGEIRVGSKFRKNQLHRNPRSLDNWLANQNFRVLHNALRTFIVFRGHGVHLSATIIAYTLKRPSAAREGVQVRVVPVYHNP